MARITLQVKNIASLVLAAGASVAFGFASRRFDNPAKPWLPPALLGAFFLACQLALIFVESKEEEELSLTRRRRMAEVQQWIEEQKQFSIRIQEEISSGNLAGAGDWIELRRKHGK